MDDQDWQQFELKGAEGLANDVSIENIYRKLPAREVDLDAFIRCTHRWSCVNAPEGLEREPTHQIRAKLERISAQAEKLFDVIDLSSEHIYQTNEALVRLMGSLGGAPERPKSYVGGSEFIEQFRSDLVRLKDAAKDAAGGRPGDKPGPKTEYIMRSALEQLMHIWVWSTGRRRLGTPFENFALILLIGRGFEIHGDDVTDKWPKLFNSVRIVWRKRSSNDGIRYFPTT